MPRSGPPRVEGGGGILKYQGVMEVVQVAQMIFVCQFWANIAGLSKAVNKNFRPGPKVGKFWCFIWKGRRLNGAGIFGIFISNPQA